ncbi:hypothetical protein CASFOL_023578 [Castilleja foliolosa]|uniref:Uncharacterized protein n=1 Tax=Castilleja foliolosa TaxID=1961234 RepID=A0ABD3CMY1_9LAMI
MVTSLSLAISYPTLAAAPHMFINAIILSHRPIMSRSIDPSKFAAPVAAAASGGAPAAAAAEVEKKEEPAEESDDDLGFSLFD